NTEVFYKHLKDNSIEFFTGVPDSLLKNLCAYLTDNVDKSKNIIAANEGNALGMAAGHYLATGNIPVVYMQNSGLGNIVNPLASLTDALVYSIPALLIVGWRGEPNKKDEPQHKKQG
ncbi:MAG: thiamine pyrophosphate-binding protein, partial [Clostridium sp.]